MPAQILHLPYDLPDALSCALLPREKSPVASVSLTGTYNKCYTFGQKFLLSKQLTLVIASLKLEKVSLYLAKIETINGWDIETLS